MCAHHICTYEYPKRTEEGHLELDCTQLGCPPNEMLRTKYESSGRPSRALNHPPRHNSPGLKPQILTWYSKLYISNIILVLCQSQGSLQSWSCLHPDYWHVLPHWNYLTSFPQFSSCSLTGELLFIDKAGSYLLGSMLWNLPALWSSCHYHRIKASLARGLSLCLSS